MSADTQENILKTAGHLFYRFGIRSVSIDDICKELGMSKKTFYTYYPTKDDLVAATLNASVERMKLHTDFMLDKQNIRASLHQFAAHQAEDNTDVRRIPQLFRDLKKYYPQQYEVYQQQVFDLQRGQIRDALKAGIDDGLIRDNIDIEMTSLLFAKVHSDTIRDMEQMIAHNVDIKKYTHNTLHVLVCGILTPEGFAIMDQHK